MPIQIQTYTDAKEFLGGLQEYNWHGFNVSSRGRKWAFRGQWDSEWDLTPSAFRDRKVLGRSHAPYVVDSTSIDSFEQKEAEYWAIQEFAAVSDSLGLAIPYDHFLFRPNPHLPKAIGHSIGVEDWPPFQCWPVLALAQHYGVPTRFLDFTYKWDVAAYFAAECSRSKSNEPFPEHISVWALNLPVIYQWGDWSDRLRIVTVPRAYNQFLHAQEGFFLHDSKRRFGDSPALNKIIDDFEERAYLVEHSIHREPPIIQFRVLSSQSEEILRLLEAQFIDEAHLKPSFESVIRSLERKRIASQNLQRN